MSAHKHHHTLVVANRTAEAPVLLQLIDRRAEQRPTAFTLLIPDVTDPRTVDWTLEEALKAMREAARGPAGLREPRVEGRIGGADPYESVKQALEEGDYDDVIICTLPKRTSRWLKRDLPTRVKALGVPVTVISAPDKGSTFAQFVDFTDPGEDHL